MRAALVVIGLMATASVAAGPSRVDIELLPQVQVGGTMILLGQVAHLRSSDLPLMRRLVELPLGRLPSPGHDAVLRREALVRWLAHEAELQPGDVSWSGADQTRVMRQRHVISGMQIGAAASEAVQAMLAARAEVQDVEVVGWPRDVEVTSPSIRLRARSLAQAPLRRRQLVWVELWSGEDFIRAVPVALELTSSERASALLQYGPGKSIPFEGPTLGGPIDVGRGEWANLRGRSGAIALETRVEVLQDGRIGEKVRVRQSGATGIVHARVIGRGRLELAP